MRESASHVGFGYLPSTAAGCVLAIAACGLGDATAYTLYRNSVMDANARIHVATFDADEKGSYNSENCEVARGLFQAQDGVTTRFWCEKGRYLK